jgi:uncharacterized protein
LLPGTLLRSLFDSRGGQVVPRTLDAGDHPWLRALIDEHERYAGRRRSELDERLARPLLPRAPRRKLQVALAVVERLSRARTEAPVPPRRARAAVFRRAAANDVPRREILAGAAVELGLEPEALEEALFADLPSEQRVLSLGPLSVQELTRQVNAAILASLLARASIVHVRAYGKTRALVRHARLLGLLCVVTTGGPDQMLLEISGPFALFRRTRLYGRALASLLSRLAWCGRWELRARLDLPGGSGEATLRLRSGDPVLAGRELPAYDSALEERFARDFGRSTKDWELVREPAPIAAGNALLFVDFELRHRDHPERRWLLEIIGFWTPDYLDKKRERLARAGIERLILCVDVTRGCAMEELPAGARVVAYRRRIDVRKVLEILEQ